MSEQCSVCVYSSLIFLTNIFLALYYDHYFYAFLFAGATGVLSLCEVEIFTPLGLATASCAQSIRNNQSQPLPITTVPSKTITNHNCSL